MTKNLSLPHWIHRLYRLHLTDHKVLNQNVEPQSFVEEDSIVTGTLTWRSVSNPLFESS